MRIHRLVSWIANVYLIETGDGLVVVDSGFRGSTPAILRAARRLGYAAEAIRLIALTHVHMDHAGSAAALRRATSAPIALHRADVPKARAGSHNLPSGRGWTGRTLERVFNGLRLRFPYEPFEPDVLLEPGQSLDTYGFKARVLATPGHTLGSVSFELPDGILIVGDAIINQLRVGMPMYGEDTALAYASARSLLAHSPQLLYSGHGRPFAGAELVRYFEAKRVSASLPQSESSPPELGLDTGLDMSGLQGEAQTYG